VGKRPASTVKSGEKRGAYWGRGSRYELSGRGRSTFIERTEFSK